MVKRMLSLVLASAMLLVCLSGCGSSSEATSANADLYASDTALSLFDTLEGIAELEDFSFEMPVYALSDSDGTQGDLIYTVSGVSYASTQQAYVSLTDGDGEAITEIYVDGATCYINYWAAINYVKSGYESTDAEALSEDIEAMEAVVEESSEYLTVELQEDIWTTLEGDSFSSLRERLVKLYKSIRRDMAEKSKDGDHTSSITIAGADLQTQLLKVLDSLIDHSSDYTSFLEAYLSDNFEEFMDIIGWTAEETVDIYWDAFENLSVELYALEANGEWNDWSVYVISCGDEENGYTIDLTSTGSYNRNICLSVYPAEAETLEMPTDTTDYLSELENATYIYQAFRGYFKTVLAGYSLDTDDEDDADEDEDDDDDSVSTELTVSAIDGYERIGSALAATEDGVDLEVPVFTNYTSGEIVASEQSGGATDIYQVGEGFTLEWYSLDSTTRTPEEIIEDNVTGYEEVYEDEWGYEIVTEPVSIVVSDDGEKAVGAFAYYDEEEETEVTMINAAVWVDDSEYALCVEIRFYADTVMNRDINSAKDLLAYLGLELPIDVIQN